MEDFFLFVVVVVFKQYKLRGTPLECVRKKVVVVFSFKPWWPYQIEKYITVMLIY